MSLLIFNKKNLSAFGFEWENVLEIYISFEQGTETDKGIDGYMYI